MAVNLPKGGDTTLMIHPEIKYQPPVSIGPSHPTKVASFLENNIISSIGLVKFKYRLAKD